MHIFAGEELVAEHRRNYEKHQVIEDWRHYVPLLLKKSFAVPWASALRHGELPATFETARQELVAHCPNGNREFARLLELCLTHDVSAVEAALLQACVQGSWSVDAVRHLLNFASAPQDPPPPLYPAQYPAYQGMTAKANLSAYNRLLEVQP